MSDSGSSRLVALVLSMSLGLATAACSASSQPSPVSPADKGRSTREACAATQPAVGQGWQPIHSPACDALDDEP
jgi:hypothetical protein